MKQNTRQVICEITDQDFDPSFRFGDMNKYRVRRASRGLLIRGDKTALIHISKKNYHKLPGGGIEPGETEEEAFAREVKEETGCVSTITDKGPVTIEYRDKQSLLHISYIFRADFKEKIGEVNYEPDEIEEGAKLVWIKFKDIEKIFAKDKPLNYEDLFIHKRDRAIFQHFKNSNSF